VAAHEQLCSQVHAAYEQALAAHELRQQQWRLERPQQSVPRVAAPGTVAAAHELGQAARTVPCTPRQGRDTAACHHVHGMGAQGMAAPPKAATKALCVKGFESATSELTPAIVAPVKISPLTPPAAASTDLLAAAADAAMAAAVPASIPAASEAAAAAVDAEAAGSRAREAREANDTRAADAAKAVEMAKVVAATAARRAAWLLKAERVKQHSALCAQLRADFGAETQRVLEHNRRCAQRCRTWIVQDP
jgi:hypothetical protein